MKLKKTLTGIAACIMLCFMFQVTCQAAVTDEIAPENGNEIAQEEVKYTESELRYMTTIIYCEARGESYAGQKAVGIVVMNRVRSKKFPNSIKKVIYQKKQFSPVRNGSLSKALDLYDEEVKAGELDDSMESCMDAAKEVLGGSTTIEVNGKTKQMKKYLFFSQYISRAKYKLGGHQFK